MFSSTITETIQTLFAFWQDVNERRKFGQNRSFWLQECAWRTFLTKWNTVKFLKEIIQPCYKRAGILQRYHWIPRGMTSKDRAQKSHSDDVSQPKFALCFWLVESNFLHSTTNWKHCPDLCDERHQYVFSAVVWSLDVISWGTQWWHREMSAVFSSYL